MAEFRASLRSEGKFFRAISSSRNPFFSGEICASLLLAEDTHAREKAATFVHSVFSSVDVRGASGKFRTSFSLDGNCASIYSAEHAACARKSGEICAWRVLWGIFALVVILFWRAGKGGQGNSAKFRTSRCFLGGRLRIVLSRRTYHTRAEKWRYLFTTLVLKGFFSETIARKPTRCGRRAR